MPFLSEHPFGAGGLAARMHQLDNGLKILLLRDPAAPIIAYQTWFAVGSRHEVPGRTGIAHLFEHLMFNQTESHPPGEFDRLLESVGGETNAATWVDWTYYRNNLPRTELELAIALESDRMAHLTLGITQVESEREVVANERRFRVEDDVDGFLNEEIFKLAFAKHPYHWPTIGWMRDIKAISIDDCRAFYRTYYAPNNATLVLVGDFDEPEALGLIERHYGAIAPQAIPAESFQSEPEQREERRASWVKPVTADKLSIGYKSPPLADPDYLRLELLSEVLFGGNSSRLYRQLVAEGEIATSVSAAATPFRDVGLFEISLALQRGHVAEEAETIIYRELEKVAREPPSPGELDMARARLMTRFWRDLRPQAGKAEALGHFQTTAGDYRRLFAIADAYQRIVASDLASIAGTYLQPSRRTVVMARPPAVQS